MLNITIQLQNPEILLLFFVMIVYYEKLGRMMKLIVPKFYSDLSVRLRDVAEKQVPAS